MPGQPVKLGPFKGGINTFSDNSALDDTELVDCVNLEVALDGTLVSRPPIKTTTNNGAWTQKITILGTADFGDVYLFGSNNAGTWYFHGGAWTLLTNAAVASCMVQYRDAVYFTPYPDHATISLFKWSPLGGYVNVSPANLNTMMGGKGGGAMAIYKERLFITPGFSRTVNQSRLIFSDPGAPETFSSTTQFIDINPGDGTMLMDLVVQEDNLLLFKDNSTWVLTYTSSPSDAELLCMNKEIGIQWLRCIVPYENSVFVLHKNRCYEINNFKWTCVNVRTPFFSDTGAPVGTIRVDNVFMSRLGDRLVVRLLNSVWVYGIRTDSWTRWESEDPVLHNFGPLVHYQSQGEDSYWAGSSIREYTQVVKIQDRWTSTDQESNAGTPVDIECRILTKNYDLQTSHQFKRLNWWGMDAVTFNEVQGSVQPVVFGYLPTWGQLNSEGKTWDDLEYWGAVAAISRIFTTISSENSGQLRRFFRFPHNIRFRQVNFQVVMHTSGTTIDGPAKIFSLTAIGSVKQIVPSDIN